MGSDELAALQRIEALLRSLVKISLTDTMSQVLTDEKLRELYLGTGKLKREELEAKTGFSGGKISGLWAEWERIGLLIKDGKSYRKPFE